MAVYLLNIIFTFLFANTANKKRNKVKDNSDVRDGISKSYLACIFVAWVLVYALRGITGADAYYYYRMYKTANLTNMSAIEYALAYRDKLFHFLDYSICKLSDGNWVIDCAFFGALTYLPVLLVIKKESVNLTVSTLLYIFSLSYCYGFNGIRQGLSISFCLMAYYLFFKEKKYIYYLLCMLIAYGFHSATVLVVVFHILSRLRFKSSLVRIGLIAAALGSLFVIQNWDIVINIFQAFGQEKMAADYVQIRGENGSGLIRALVALAPAALTILKYPDLQKKYKDIDSDLLMSLFGGIFMLYSMQTWYIAQIAAYFGVFNIILLPKVLNSFPSKVRGQLTVAVMLLYFFYMIALLLHGDGGFYPYIPVWKMVV